MPLRHVIQQSPCLSLASAAYHLSAGLVLVSQVYVGFDGAYLEALQAGLDGNVSSGGGAVLVDTFQHIDKAYRQGDIAAAQEGQKRMDAWWGTKSKYSL